MWTSWKSQHRRQYDRREACSKQEDSREEDRGKDAQERMRQRVGQSKSRERRRQQEDSTAKDRSKDSSEMNGVHNVYRPCNE